MKIDMPLNKETKPCRPYIFDILNLISYHSLFRRNPYLWSYQFRLTLRFASVCVLILLK